MISTYRKMFALLDRQERRKFKILTLLLVVVSLFEAAGLATIMPFLAILADPQVVQENEYLNAVYNYFRFPSTYAFLIAVGIGVFFVVVFGIFLKIVSTYFLIRFSARRGFSVSMRLLESYLSQPYVWFLNRDSSALSKSILSEVDQILNGVFLPGLRVIANSIFAMSLILVIIIVDPVTSMLAAATLGASYVLVFLASRKYLSRIGEKRVAANSERFQIVNEVFSGIKDVKLLGLERHYVQSFRDPALRTAGYISASQSIRELPRWIFEAIAFGGMIILILVLLYTNQGVLADILPTLGFFAVAGFRLFPTLQQIYHNASYLRFGRPALDAIYQDLQEVRDTGDPEVYRQVDIPALPLSETVSIGDVVYSYPGSKTPSLNKINISIPVNTTVGLVGGTGAGKTTLVDIVLGLLRPQQGSLRIDGVVVDDQKLRQWQRSIGYVPQHIYITNDSVAANIAFGVPREQIDMAAVERAAQTAAIHDFVVDELPKGYATTLGERGVRLSGGQRQRIGIARALYRNPPVLVFDEATSALDNLTEKVVMEAIYRLSSQKTIILIAHRLSTVEPCDRIFMLGEGRVIAEGTFSELLERSADFGRLAGRMDFEDGNEAEREVSRQQSAVP